jgi:hypothetical protein
VSKLKDLDEYSDSSYKVEMGFSSSIEGCKPIVLFS